MSSRNNLVLQKIGEFAIKGVPPTDKEIEELSLLIYERDKNKTINFDAEMEAVRRGIVQGAILMKQIMITFKK